MSRFLIILVLFAGCSNLAQMKESLDHASTVIEENTQKIEQSAYVIEQNTKKMNEAGLIIEKNTQETRVYTYVMQFAFPLFCLTLFLFNFMFFHKILKKIRSIREHNHLQ